jgi:hypothetical protein
VRAARGCAGCCKGCERLPGKSFFFIVFCSRISLLKKSLHTVHIRLMITGCCISDDLGAVRQVGLHDMSAIDRRSDRSGSSPRGSNFRDEIMGIIES